MTESGREDAPRVESTQPTAIKNTIPLSRSCRRPPSTGGGIHGFFFVGYYVFNDLTVEMQSYQSGIRCFKVSASQTSDHRRLFG